MKNKADIKEDKLDIDIADRGEPVSLMEPLLISDGSQHRRLLADLVVELASHSAGFRRSLPQGVLRPLAELVRAMNCYYSNLIEGHNTHPVDIERALRNDFSANLEKRNLQLEAKAHIKVQKWIDEGGLRGRTTTVEGICEIHLRFGKLLPDELLWVEAPVQPHRLRDRILLWVEEEVRNGALPPKAGSILEAVLFQGELPRGDVANILGTGPRHSRRLVATLIEQNILVSESSRAPLRLAFPARLAWRWMPGLFPPLPQ